MPDKEPKPETNPWITPEARELIRAQFMEDIDSGVLASFAREAAGMYPDPDDPLQVALTQLSMSEAPLKVVIDRNIGSEVVPDKKVNKYFLIKVNPDTGDRLETEEGDGLIWVADLSGDGQVDTKSDTFTDDQVGVVFKHGQELEVAGLLDPDFS